MIYVLTRVKIYSELEERENNYERFRVDKITKENGCSLVGHGGRHDEWFSPITGKTFPVPRHNKEVPKGTALSILKDAGLK